MQHIPTNSHLTHIALLEYSAKWFNKPVECGELKTPSESGLRHHHSLIQFGKFTKTQPKFFVGSLRNRNGIEVTRNLGVNKNLGKLGVWCFSFPGSWLKKPPFFFSVAPKSLEKTRRLRDCFVKQPGAIDEFWGEQPLGLWVHHRRPRRSESLCRQIESAPLKQNRILNRKMYKNYEKQLKIT